MQHRNVYRSKFLMSLHAPRVCSSCQLLESSVLSEHITLVLRYMYSFNILQYPIHVSSKTGTAVFTTRHSHRNRFWLLRRQWKWLPYHLSAAGDPLPAWQYCSIRDFFHVLSCIVWWNTTNLPQHVDLAIARIGALSDHEPHGLLR